MKNNELDILKLSKNFGMKIFAIVFLTLLFVNLACPRVKINNLRYVKIRRRHIRFSFIYQEHRLESSGLIGNCVRERDFSSSSYSFERCII